MAAAVETVVDWAQMLTELRNMGVGAGVIAMRVNLSSGNIREYRLGVKSPMHCNGEKIIEYWMHKTSKTRDQLPMTEKVVAIATGT